MARRARVLREQQVDQHPQALRRHLIRVTQRLLSVHGLTGLTTRGIAREAQVSDGVLYNHFADKDELVVEALTEELADRFSAATATCPTAGKQDLRTGLTALVRLCLGLHAEVFPLISGLLARPDLMHRTLDRLHTGQGTPQRMWHAMASYVGSEQELGTIAPDVTPETVAEILFAVTHLHSLTRLLSLEKVPSSPATMTEPDIERLVGFLLRACAPSVPI